MDDDAISRPDPKAAPELPAQHLRPVPAGDPAGAAQRKHRPGPRTPKGKKRVSRNAVSHGIFASDPVIPGLERIEDWEAHKAGILKSLAPVGYLQTQLAERMAESSWRLKRVGRYERTEFIRANKGHEDFRLPALPELDKIMRYEAHLSRQYYQAKHELEALQKESRGEATPLARLDVQGLAEQ